MIDTHIHIDDEAYRADREEVIARQKEAGVEAMIVPSVSCASIESVLDICRKHPHYCYPCLGLHPEEVKENWEQEMTTMEAAIRNHHKDIVAVGEIGLDYYWDKTFKEQQKEVLRRQLLLAQEYDLPVILHNREATEDILTVIKEIQMANGKSSNGKSFGVFHCFSGSRETAEQVVKMGFYIGVGGVLTFKNSKLKEHLSAVPLERIVIETDGPYMAPVPHRGERNESRFMAHVVDMLAELYCTTPQAIIDVTTRNAKQLFRL